MTAHRRLSLSYAHRENYTPHFALILGKFCRREALPKVSISLVPQLKR